MPYTFEDINQSDNNTVFNVSTRAAAPRRNF